MKKNIYILFLLFSLNSYSYLYKTDISFNRGLQLMRENNFTQISNLSKISGSLQNFETFFENNKKIQTRGYLLGTSSNFIDFPNINTGLTTNYLKIKLKNNSLYDRQYSLNTYLTYRKDLYLFIGNIGYSQDKEVSARKYGSYFEIGKFSKENSLKYVDKNRFYYYMGFNSNIWKTKEKNEDIRFNNYRLGITAYNYIDKFRIIGNLELNKDNKIYEIDREKYNLSFSCAFGYNIYEDLLIELKYEGSKNKQFYNNLFSIGFTHIF